MYRICSAERNNSLFNKSYKRKGDVRLMKLTMEKLAKILFAILIMVISIHVLTSKIPDSEYIQETIDHLEKSQNTVMAFSGTSITTSLALSALPNDFASPLASTIADLNTYFIFMFAVLFVEKLLVIEGISFVLTWIIPASCLFYVGSVVFSKDLLRSFAGKLMILGLSVIIVIPFSTHFTETICADYLAYVEETISETEAGTSKINEVMTSGDEESSFFDRLSDAFKTAIQDVSDLLAYFKNVIKKCVNAVAIMLVTTFVVPMLMMLLFRWLLSELFSLHLPTPNIQLKLPKPDCKPSRKETEDQV